MPNTTEETLKCIFEHAAGQSGCVDMLAWVGVRTGMAFARREAGGVLGPAV